MKPQQIRAIDKAFRNGGSGEHALVLVVILTIFAMATMIAMTVPQAIELVAAHANGAPLILMEAEYPSSHQYGREAKSVDTDPPAY